MKRNKAPLPRARIQALRSIVWVRGQRVMIDADLADLYGVPTKALNQAVKRNRERFPADFMFKLSAREKKQVVTACDHLARLRFSRTHRVHRAQRSHALEKRHDSQFQVVFDAIRRLMADDSKPRRRIGFSER